MTPFLTVTQAHVPEMTDNALYHRELKRPLQKVSIFSIIADSNHMDKAISEIIRNKKHCYFISPHLDDAVLSAGGLLSYLAGKTDVTLVTVFTEAGEKPYTMSAKGFLRYCGYTDAKKLFTDRRLEDKEVAAKLGINTIHLGFIDGSFRRRTKNIPFTADIAKRIPEINHLYPLGRKLIKIAGDDKQTVQEIQKKLLQAVTTKDSIVFCPVGSVKHMDHILTTKACTNIFQNLYFWTDFPYIKNVNLQNMRAGDKSLKKFVWKQNVAEKQVLIQLYKTQKASLLTTGKLESAEEVYWHEAEPSAVVAVKRSYKFLFFLNRFNKAFA